MPKEADPPTKAELLALRAICREGTAQGAARRLQLSAHTVDKQLDNLRVKTGAHHLPQLICHAYEQGWLDDDLDLQRFTGKKRGPRSGWKGVLPPANEEQGSTRTVLEGGLEP